MILTDMLELVGKTVEVELNDGRILGGTLEYVPAYSAMYDFRKAKHFFIGDVGFRSYHVKKAVVL